MSKLMKLSTAQLDVLKSVRTDGRVQGKQSTIAALTRRRLVENPMYGRGISWAAITELGRTVADGQ